MRFDIVPGATDSNAGRYPIEIPNGCSLDVTWTWVITINDAAETPYVITEADMDDIRQLILEEFRRKAKLQGKRIERPVRSWLANLIKWWAR